MEKEEYIKLMEAVLKQYNDGAIMACEVANKLCAESYRAAQTDWFNEEWKLINGET